jgi:hypothetical protein
MPTLGSEQMTQQLSSFYIPEPDLLFAKKARFKTPRSGFICMALTGNMVMQALSTLLPMQQ